DVEDRLGLARKLVPDAERCEQALAGIGDRGRAAVEGRLGHGLERQPVDQRGAKPRLARRQGEQAAVQAGADNGDVEAVAVGDALHVPYMAAATGKIGDGKIFVYEIQQAIRIRTGEAGAEAL